MNVPSLRTLKIPIGVQRNMSANRSSESSSAGRPSDPPNGGVIGGGPRDTFPVFWRAIAFLRPRIDPTKTTYETCGEFTISPQSKNAYISIDLPGGGEDQE